jgi:hypothetical protein
MDFTNPEVIRRHNRNAWTIRGLMLLWLGICYFPTIWVLNRFTQFHWGSYLSPFKLVFGLIAIVLPILIISIFALFRWLISILSSRLSA